MVGFVPAWECSASIGGFELGGGNDLLNAIGVGEGGAIEAAQFVVELSVEPDAEMCFSRKESAFECESDSLGLGVESNAGDT